LVTVKGIDVNERAGRDKGTPLHVAVGTGNLAIVQLLVEHGADLTACTASGETIYTIARKCGVLDKLLLEIVCQLLCDRSPLLCHLTHK